MLIINEEKRLNFIELRILLEKILLQKRNVKKFLKKLVNIYFNT